MLQEQKTQLKGGAPTLKVDEKGIIELQEHNTQPNLGSYYNLFEEGWIIPKTFAVPLVYELEKQEGKTHRWMQISKSKNVEDVGLMEEKVTEMGKELSDSRLRE